MLLSIFSRQDWRYKNANILDIIETNLTNDRDLDYLFTLVMLTNTVNYCREKKLKSFSILGRFF